MDEPVVTHLSTKSGWSVETAVDYLLAAIAAQGKLYESKLEMERQMRLTMQESISVAQRLESTEVKRRLDELNHAHDQAMENWRTSLPRELFEQWRTEHLRWKEEVTMVLSKAVTPAAIDRFDTRLKAIEDARNKVTGALILLGVMGAAGVVAFVLGIARLIGSVE